MKKLLIKSYLIAIGLALTGCGATKTMVLEPLERQQTVKKLNVKRDKNTAIVDAAVEKSFEEHLKWQLFTKAGFQEGNDITLQYRFLQMNEGSRFKRWMTGGLGNCGEGSTTIEVKFIDNTQNGKELGKIHTEGRIGSGLFGGSLDSAVEGVAEEIVEYAKAHLQAK